MSPSSTGRWLVPVVLGILVGGCAVLFFMRAAAQRADKRVADAAATAESAAATADAEALPDGPPTETPPYAIDPIIEATRQAYGASLPAVATASRRDAEATVIALELSATAAALGIAPGTVIEQPTAPADAPIAPLGAPPPPPGVTVDELTALTDYAQAALPIVVLALGAADRNTQAFQAARGAPDTLCAPGSVPSPRADLVADAGLLRRLIGDLQAISPPPAADLPVHQPLLESMELWATAVEAVNASCATDQPLEQGARRIEAAVRLGAAVLSFQTARANFRSLLVDYGQESLAGLLGDG